MRVASFSSAKVGACESYSLAKGLVCVFASDSRILANAVCDY